jgi:glycosyltransferase involved in cell wall biosynthesis
MKYALSEIQIDAPGPVRVADDQGGAGLLVRDGEVPVAFIMTEHAPGLITTEELRRLLVTDAATAVTYAAVRRELVAPHSGHQTPTVTVALCTRDHPDILARAIASLMATASSAGRPGGLDILVVDNAPSDQRTRQVVESFPGVRYVCEPKPGLNFARNRAIAAATGELLAYIDDDAVVDRHWLAGLTSAWQQNPDAGAFTGPVIPFELETAAQILFEQRGGFPRSFQFKRYGSDSATERNYPCNAGMFGAGCNMAFRRSMLIDLGGFDEALDTGAPLPGGGDLDMFYRVVRSGRPLIYEPRLMIAHQHRREYAALRRQMYTWGLGLMAYAAKHYARDRELRPRLRCMALGFYREIAGMGLRSLANRRGWTPDLALAELWGGIVGSCGEYGRSQRRIDRIRRQFT